MSQNLLRFNQQIFAQKVIEKLEKEESSFGHTALPEKRLLKLLMPSGEIEERDFLADLDNNSLFKKRSDDDGWNFYSSQKSFTLERQISEQISRLINTFSQNSSSDKLTKSDMRLGRGVNPSDEQIAAVNNVISNAVTVITGGPGTGKTTMVLGLVRALKSLGLSITLCAPTGKAAKRLGEATGLQKFNPSTVHMHLMKVSQGLAKKYDVMIVDEASMLDVSLLHSLISNIPDGARLVLIGDKNQLPPVASGQPFKDIIQTIEKSENYSPDNLSFKPEDGVSGIVAAAYDVITGKEPDSNLKLEEHNFEFIECAKEEIAGLVLDYYFEGMPKSLNKPFEQVQDDIQILSPQKRGVLAFSP